MTRKDYVALAAALASTRPEEYTLYNKSMWAQWAADRAAIARVLADDNERFDSKRFVTATEA